MGASWGLGWPADAHDARLSGLGKAADAHYAELLGLARSLLMPVMGASWGLGVA